jgi:hypothetical protein
LRTLTGLAISLILLLAPAATRAQGVADATAEGSATARTAVVVQSDTPDFYDFAARVAAEVGGSWHTNLGTIFMNPPEYVLWLGAPSDFSDEDIIEFGMRERELGHKVSVGIIAGETVEDASGFWARRKEVKGDRTAEILGRYPARHREGHIIEYGEEGANVLPLSVDSIWQLLQRTDYAAYRGHGSPRGLLFLSGKSFGAPQVPDLPPVVFAAYACNTFRFWEEESIARAFVEKGAAAYAGSAYSPPGGGLLGLSFKHTWPGFSIGHVLSVQSRAGVRSGSAFRFYHLLGDPRVSMRSEPPYEIVQDVTVEGVRTVRFDGAPDGVIPIRIPGGAKYTHIEVPGIATVSESDLFMNVRLQAADLANDKLILLDHPGGPFTVRLHETAPAVRFLADPVLRSLDMALVVNFDPQRGGALILTGYGFIAIGILWIVVRRNADRRWILWPGIVTALDFALIHGLYAWFRQGEITFIDFPMQFAWYGLVGTALIGFVGGVIVANAARWKGFLTGLLVSLLPFLGGSLIAYVILWIVNAQIAGRAGAGIYNYHLPTQHLVAAGVIGVVFLLYFALLRFLARAWGGKPGEGA